MQMVFQVVEKDTFGRTKIMKLKKTVIYMIEFVVWTNHVDTGQNCEQVVDRLTIMEVV